jgi:hypothetical protein
MKERLAGPKGRPLAASRQARSGRLAGPKGRPLAASRQARSGCLSGDVIGRRGLVLGTVHCSCDSTAYHLDRAAGLRPDGRNAASWTADYHRGACR